MINRNLRLPILVITFVTTAVLISCASPPKQKFTNIESIPKHKSIIYAYSKKLNCWCVSDINVRRST